MQYMLVFRETDQDFAKRDDPKAAPEYWGAWKAYVGAVRAADAFVAGNALQPPQTATVVSLRNGKRQVQDGPFAETREFLGGYFVVELPTLDDALAWAARAPCAASGSVEVRPVLDTAPPEPSR